jgi:hypothetical protein
VLEPPLRWTTAWPGYQTFCGWKGSGVDGKGDWGLYDPRYMREQVSPSCTRHNQWPTPAITPADVGLSERHAAFSGYERWAVEILSTVQCAQRGGFAPHRPFGIPAARRSRTGQIAAGLGNLKSHGASVDGTQMVPDRGLCSIMSDLPSKFPVREKPSATR